MKLSKNLRKIRIEKELSQYELAKRTGLTNSTIFRRTGTERKNGRRSQGQRTRF